MTGRKKKTQISVYLDPEIMDRFDLVGDALDGRRMQAVTLIAHQRLARNLEHYAIIAGPRAIGGGGGVAGGGHGRIPLLDPQASSAEPRAPRFLWRAKWRR